MTLQAKPSGSPSPGAPGDASGIDEALLRVVIETFYRKVRADALLGPIFAAEVEDWPAHLDRLQAFWSSLTLQTGRYKGTPFETHLALPDLDAGHFARWLDLFDEALGEACTPAQAEVFRTRARRVAASLETGLAVKRNSLPQAATGHHG